MSCTRTPALEIHHTPQQSHVCVYNTRDAHQPMHTNNGQLSVRAYPACCLLCCLALQLEGLDLLNCLITPLFFASTLARWPRSFLSSVYCMVLAIKGYQMALLLLPAARKYKAHAKSRCAGACLRGQGLCRNAPGSFTLR